MKVNELLNLCQERTLYKLVDASRPGYPKPHIITEYTDRNVIIPSFGTMNIVGLEAGGKNKILLYVTR